MMKSLRYLAPLMLSGTQTRLSILIYHRVLDKPDFMRPNEPDLVEFDWQMALLRNYFHPLSLAEALVHLDEGSLPKHSVCVTFDDGYSDNLHLALPILKKWNIPASIFVSTGFLNGGIMWNDVVIETLRNHSADKFDATQFGLEWLPTDSPQARQKSAQVLLRQLKHQEPCDREAAIQTITGQNSKLPKSLMLSDDEVVALHRAGIDIGGHTVSHPILSCTDDAHAMQEIVSGRKYLAELINSEVPHFAYPNGRFQKDFNETHVNMVKSMGFTAAVATDHGTNDASTDKYRLRRFTPWDKTPIKFYLRMLRNAAG